MSLITLIQSAYDIIQHEMTTRARSSNDEDKAAQASIVNKQSEVSIVIPEGNVSPEPTLINKKTMGLRISANGIVELANYEALANQSYLDSGGVKTVGIGLTKSDVPDLASWPWAKTITDLEAVNLYLQALRKYDTAVTKALKVKVSTAQFDALVSITYNIGIAGMQGSTFMKRVNAEAPAKDVVTAISWWNQDNGKVIQGLVNRRKAEGLVYSTGQYKNDGTVTRIAVAPATHKPVYRGKVNIAQYL